MGVRTTPPITYLYLWKKYRPAILNLMVASEKGTMEYKFSSHEFRDINQNKGNYSFVLRAHKGKAINNIKTSLVARDLLEVLQNSEKANQLIDSAIYEFELDKHFVLHIKHESIPEPEKTESKEDSFTNSVDADTINEESVEAAPESGDDN